jgi:cell division control protein 11
LDVDAGRLTLTILDTPGFGDSIDNEAAFDTILKYVEEQYDNVMAEESRIKRNTKSIDSRIHCILYFVTPTGHGLKEIDLEFVKRLGPRCNVIPVLAKSDTLTKSEKQALKQKVLFSVYFFKSMLDLDPNDRKKVAFFQFPRI